MRTYDTLIRQTRCEGVYTLARALLKTASVELLAELLNETLCPEQDAILSDEEVEACEWLFDAISEARPDAVELAQSGGTGR